jgi:iron only hydrogenase large subunit-like protein
MLITLQSHLEVQAYISAHIAHHTSATYTADDPPPDSRKGIISISPQSLASLCASYTTTHRPQTPLVPRTLLRRIRAFLEREENGAWTVCDTTFARHMSLREHVREFRERRAAAVGKGKEPAEGVRSAAGLPEDGDTNADKANGAADPMTSLRGNGLPMLASACPGWVCYAEKAHGELLGFVSAVRSSQGVMGALVKQWWGPKQGRK